MKKVFFFTVLFLASIFATTLSAQPYYAALSFKNPTIVGNKFRITLSAASVGSLWGIGVNNLRFNYTSAALGSPTIYSTNFVSPFNASTFNGSIFSSGLVSCNTSLTSPSPSNLNTLPILSSGTNLITLEFPIINSNTPITFSWRTTSNPKTAIVEDDLLTPINISSAPSLTINNLSQVTASSDVTLDCNTASTTLTASNGGGNSYLWSTGATTASITVSPTITTTYRVTATNGSTEEVVVTKDACTSVASRVYLPQTNINTLLMTPYLNTLANFPLSDPYSTAPLNTKFVHVNSGPVATTTPLVVNQTGNNAIIDWVFLELRTGTSGSTVVAYTKAALLQADGDIVDMDGVSPARFINAPVGNYYFTVRHRNHLGFRTANMITISSATPAINLSNGSIAIYGNTSMTPLTANLNTMVGGDADSDGSVDAFDTIIWEQQNGLFDDYGLVSDYDMDGSADAFDSIIWELNNGKFEELD